MRTTTPAEKKRMQTALNPSKRIITWVTDRNCDKCDGNGFYDVDFHAKHVFLEHGKYPKYETTVKVRVVCKCVKVE